MRAPAQAPSGYVVRRRFLLWNIERTPGDKITVDELGDKADVLVRSGRVDPVFRKKPGPKPKVV